MTIKQGEIVDILTEDKKVCGVKTSSNGIYPCKAVILCTGTYLNSRCVYGEVVNYTGPNGLQSANHLTESLEALGLENI